MRFFPSFHAAEIFISKWLEMSRVCIAYLYGAITKHIFYLNKKCMCRTGEWYANKIERMVNYLKDDLLMVVEWKKKC